MFVMGTFTVNKTQQTNLSQSTTGILDKSRSWKINIEINKFYNYYQIPVQVSSAIKVYLYTVQQRVS